jgi:hypothetical protein
MTAGNTPGSEYLHVDLGRASTTSTNLTACTPPIACLTNEDMMPDDFKSFEKPKSEPKVARRSCCARKPIESNGDRCGQESEEESP